MLGKKGAKDCETGSTISDRSECESACGDLNLQKDTLWNGGVCFVRTNRKCAMDDTTKLCNAKLNCPLICKISGS